MAAPLPNETLDADRTTLLALKDLADYTAVNADYATAALIALEADVLRAQAATAQARAALAAARAAEIAVVRDFHNRVLVAKAAVIAQYGHDAPALRAIGLKRKSDYKRPARRSAPATDAT
ncbi:MAG: hypothetical protein IPO81_31710 [Kouleothrix sp.]|nr:hypothetical protein [Kouleothrix sp.]